MFFSYHILYEEKIPKSDKDFEKMADFEEEEETFWTKFDLVIGPNEKKELQYEREGDDCLLTSVTLVKNDGKKPVKLFVQCKDFKEEGNADDAKLMTRKDEVVTLNKVDEEQEIERFLPYCMKPSFIVEGNGTVKITGVFADKGMIQQDDEEEEEEILEEEEEEEEQKEE